MALYNWSFPEIANCISWNNSLDEIYVAVDGGAPVVSYSDIEGGWTGTENINSDPLFTSPVGYDFQLSSSSLCIDSGDPTSPLDPDGTRNDMGALYYDQFSVSCATISCSSGNVSISWEAVPGAISYSIYSSQNPYGTFLLEQDGILTTSWNETPSGNMKYYYVIAVK